MTQVAQIVTHGKAHNHITVIHHLLHLIFLSLKLRSISHHGRSDMVNGFGCLPFF